MTLLQSVQDLLTEIGPGKMMSTAYDTAWIGRLAELGEPIGEEALEWLREHQLEDGSWGAGNPKYYHDRFICTLAAVTALARQGKLRDRVRLEKARLAMETVVRSLAHDALAETIGFEMIAPTLAAEAEKMGIILRRRDTGDLSYLTPQRTAKLAALPDGTINRYVTVAFSAEMAGLDGQHLLDVARLQEANGSVAHSPSATAYFALYVRPGDPAAMSYLRSLPTHNGGVPDVAPFDIFERAWTLWNLQLAGSLDSTAAALCEPHLDFLENAWISGKGAGFAAEYTTKDADETGVTYEVLNRFGRSADVDAIFSFENDDYFRCYALEANPSVSANIHVLSALRQAGLEARHPSAQKIVRFLQSTQFWFDKWHVSPYYPSAHAIIAGTGYVDELLEDAVSWILTTQNGNGSWGYFMPTAEETAYCLQALAIQRQHGRRVPDEVLERGAAWLMEHMDAPYPPLWIGKCLYCPVLVVRSTILSALMLVSQDVRV